MDEQRSVILCTGHVLLNVFLCSSYVRTSHTNLRAGYFWTCKVAEFIGKHTVQLVVTDTYDRISSNRERYLLIEFQFPLGVCFYTAVEVKCERIKYMHSQYQYRAYLEYGGKPQWSRDCL